jgi:hypothetical protein
MCPDGQFSRRFRDNVTESIARRLSHLSMYSPVSIEESVLPPECAVDKLVNNHKLAGAHCAAKRTHRARRDYRVSAQFF